MPGMNTMCGAGAAMLGAIGLFTGDTAAQVAKNVLFTPATPYLSPADSPYFGDGRSCHSLENFQEGRLTVPGFSFHTAAGAAIVSPGGVVDPGSTQYALSGTNSVGMLQLDFHQEILGGLPNRVGFAWTRGFNGTITLTVVNGRGGIANHVHQVNNPNLPGNPADDLFFGVRSEAGIASLLISFNPPFFCEIDHVQFALPTVDSDGDGTADCLDTCPLDRTNRCRVRGDVNGDGTPDVVVQDNVSRQVSAWLLGPDAAAGETWAIGTPPAGYLPVGYSDFGADGVREVLLQNAAARRLMLWSLGGSRGSDPVRLDPVMANKKQPFAPGSNWIVQGTADFDGDGQTDILARDSGTGVMNVWRMIGATVVSTHSLASVPSNPAWVIGGVIEGPTAGTTRIVAQNKVNRRVIVWSLNGFSPAGSQYVLTGSGAYAVLPSGSTVVGLRKFTGEAGLSLLVRSSVGKVDRWALDVGNRYLRGSEVTPDNRGSWVPRAD
jgi:hypothetical protein